MERSGGKEFKDLIVDASSSSSVTSSFVDAFFGNDIVEEVELGGFNNEEESFSNPMLGRFEAATLVGNGGDDELHEYHLFDKDEVLRRKILFTVPIHPGQM